MITSTGVVSLRPEALAVIVAVPVERAKTCPLLVTPATAVFDERQAMERLRLIVVLRTVSCTVSGTASEMDVPVSAVERLAVAGATALTAASAVGATERSDWQAANTQSDAAPIRRSKGEYTADLHSPNGFR